MNVLIVNRTALEPRKAGMARAIETLASGLAQRLRVVEFVPGPWSQRKMESSQEIRRPEYRLGVPLPVGLSSSARRWASWGFRFLSAIVQARRLVRCENIDVVHTTFHSENILFWVLKKTSGVPYVVTLHGSDAVYFDEVPAPHRRFAARVIRGASAVVAVSEQVKEAARLSFGPQLQVVRIYNGINADDVRKISRAVTPPFELPDRYVVGIGALRQVKGYDLLLRAWAEIGSKFSDVSVVIVGDGPDRARYERMSMELGVADRVVWLGWLDHDAALGVLARALTYVMPSRSEGLPYSLLEAGACGVPVIATGVGGIPEVVENGVSGWLVRPEDHTALGSALTESLLYREEAWRRSRNLINRVDTDFTVEMMVEQHVQLYESLRSC